MIIRGIRPLRWWVAMASILYITGVGLPVSVAIWYTNTVAQHACSALDLITEHPVPKPVDPAANPSREQNYEFYQAILSWKRSDSC